MTIEVHIVEDSIDEHWNRITTMQLRYPRFIHEQFLTHRMFSRNASSSRAKPLGKWINEIEEDCAYPIHWGKNKPGMQAKEEVEDKGGAYWAWYSSSLSAINSAELLYHDYGVHKQISNRLLHPFQHIDVVVTATEWENFFSLRLHDDAQPEIRELARKMDEARKESIPRLLKTGEWHLPYVTGDREDCETLRKVSAARCARVSYSNHDGTDCDIKKDLVLAEKLLESKHLSPFEHQATPMGYVPFKWMEVFGITHMSVDDDLWSGNFRGWIQHRQLLEG